MKLLSGELQKKGVFSVELSSVNVFNHMTVKQSFTGERDSCLPNVFLLIECLTCNRLTYGRRGIRYSNILGLLSPTESLSVYGKQTNQSGHNDSLSVQAA